MPFILLDTNLSTVVSDILSVFTTVFTFIIGNWYLLALIGVPLVAWLLSTVIHSFRG